LDFYFNLFQWHRKEIKSGKYLAVSRKYENFQGGKLSHLEQLSC
jgi:hypothetical protein